MFWGLGQLALEGMLGQARTLLGPVPTALLPTGSQGTPWLGHNPLSPNPSSLAAPKLMAGKLLTKIVEE